MEALESSMRLLPPLKTELSIVGGGESVSSLKLIPGSAEILSHVSTGGGASLELLEGKKLPGVVYLSDKTGSN